MLSEDGTIMLKAEMNNGKILFIQTSCCTFWETSCWICCCMLLFAARFNPLSNSGRSQLGLMPKTSDFCPSQNEVNDLLAFRYLFLLIEWKLPDILGLML